ncbi:hypothetical protein EDB85DRAFT_2276303 [Lactarius pseudohatsudake]|nr:hypothetical protein EDB85DRAFT_2276303 [Lactarius pseudohatsudake]
MAVTWSLVRVGTRRGARVHATWECTRVPVRDVRDREAAMMREGGGEDEGRMRVWGDCEAGVKNNFVNGWLRLWRNRKIYSHDLTINVQQSTQLCFFEVTLSATLVLHTTTAATAVPSPRAHANHPCLPAATASIPLPTQRPTDPVLPNRRYPTVTPSYRGNTPVTPLPPHPDPCCRHPNCDADSSATAVVTTMQRPPRPQRSDNNMTMTEATTMMTKRATKTAMATTTNNDDDGKAAAMEVTMGVTMMAAVVV